VVFYCTRRSDHSSIELLLDALALALAFAFVFVSCLGVWSRVESSRVQFARARAREPRAEQSLSAVPGRVPGAAGLGSGHLIATRGLPESPQHVLCLPHGQGLTFVEGQQLPRAHDFHVGNFGARCPPGWDTAEFCFAYEGVWKSSTILGLKLSRCSCVL
jgi:hypothetical protein